jgi:hypothetical protein
MSAKGRGDNPHKAADDFRETPQWAAHRLLDRLGRWLPRRARWLEPAAGDGAVIQAVNSWRGGLLRPKWDACELRKAALSALGKLPIDHLHCPSSFFDLAGEWDVIATNPPFTFAQQYIEHALQMTPWLALLLRLNFLGSQERREFFAREMPDVYALPNRPVMGLNKEGKLGSDATEYGWFVWGPERGRTSGRVEVLGLTSQDEVRAAKQALAKKLGIAA